MYGTCFDQTEVELLELSPEMLALVQSGAEELCFKGGPDDEAVLCTRVHPTLYTLHLAPYTLHPTPYTLHPTLYTLNPKT